MNLQEYYSAWDGGDELREAIAVKCWEGLCSAFLDISMQTALGEADAGNKSVGEVPLRCRNKYLHEVPQKRRESKMDVFACKWRNVK